MLYVTHDQVEAMTMADRIAVMHKGLLQQLATPAELYSRPVNLFVATFCGSPPMNILAGEIAEGAFHHASGSLPLPAASHARPGQARLSPGACSTGRAGGERIASRRDLCRRAARQRDTGHDRARRCARQHPPAGGFLDADRQPLRGPARGHDTCICSTTRPEKLSRRPCDHHPTSRRSIHSAHVKTGRN